MLQPLGISVEAEAVYVLLARHESATVLELVRASPGGNIVLMRDQLETLRELGLAVEVGGGRWQALPLLEAIHSLRAQRVSEIDSAAVAAEALQNRLLAATQTKHADDIVVLVGREAIVEARNEVCNSAKKEMPSGLRLYLPRSLSLCGCSSDDTPCGGLLVATGERAAAMRASSVIGRSNCNGESPTTAAAGPPAV